MEFHDAANIFPIDEERIDDLADDIAKNGQAVPIEIMGGKVLDGRRRWLACIKADVAPKTREVTVDDPVAYVLSLNLHRRHLAPSQAAMVGARAREVYDKQAKERMTAGANKGRQSQKGAVENLPQADSARARDAVGKAIGVSGKSIDYATRVLNRGTQELVKSVDEGRMAVSTAAILATEDRDTQLAEINRPKRNRKYTVGSGTVKPVGKDEPKTAAPVIAESTTEKPKVRGVGIEIANEAINCLIRIPKNDALRKRGFQIVTDWIKRNW